MGLWDKFGKKEQGETEEYDKDRLFNKDLENDLFPADGETDSYTLWCLGMAAPLSAKNESPCNKFNFNGCTPGEYRDQMVEDWGVRTADSLRDTVDELLGQETDLDSILPLLGDMSSGLSKRLRQAGWDAKQARDLAAALPCLAGNFRKAGLPLPSSTLRAWDIARAAYLAMSGYGSQLLSRSEATELLHKAGECAASLYASWEEYVCSFLLGRRLWIVLEGGYGEDPTAFDENYISMHTLLRSSKSYYAHIPFPGGAELKKARAPVPETREIELQCKKCGNTGKITQYCTMDIGKHPDWKEKLLADDIFSWKCPTCGTRIEFGYNCTYHDPKAELTAVLFTHLEDGDIDALNSRIEDGDTPDGIRRVVGLSFELKELVRIRDAGLDDRAVQMAKVLLVGMLQKSGKQISAAYFTGISPKKDGVLSGDPTAGKTPPPEGEAAGNEEILWFEVRHCHGENTQNGINRAAYEKCLPVAREKSRPDGCRFIRVDLDWARRAMNRGGGTPA